MAQKVLLVSASDYWLKSVKSALHSTSMNTEFDETTENHICQKKMKQTKFGAIYIDPDLSGGRSIEILKFIKLNYPSVRVSMIYEDKTREQKYQFLKASLKDAGIAEDFTINASLKLSLVNPAVAVSVSEQKSDLGASDRDFVSIPIESFSEKNIAIFDYYIRQKENHYIRVIQKDEIIDNVRIATYVDKGMKSLYLKIKDRRAYIKMMNGVLKITQSDLKGNFRETISTSSNLSELLLTEIHTQGLSPDVVAECKSYCDNLANLIKNNYRLGKVNELFLEMDPTELSHSFLVTFLSTVICKNLDWAGSKTAETIAMGALLHDIGIQLLPPELQDKDPETMTKEEFEKYMEHPRLGADLLLNNPNINPQVTQIVFQHHENNLGTGYPNQMPASKIYPLAKIVGLAEELAESMMADMIPPLEAIKILLQDRDRIMKFDPGQVKALVAAFKGRK